MAGKLTKKQLELAKDGKVTLAARVATAIVRQRKKQATNNTADRRECNATNSREDPGTTQAKYR